MIDIATSTDHVGDCREGAVAEFHGRRWIGFDINPRYAELAQARTAQRSLVLRKSQ